MPVIPNSTKRASRLGFGTSGLMGSALTTQGRVKLLDLAYEQGITHFDTAPLYGLGQAQKVVGKFIQGKRSQVTVTSKYGLNPATVPKYYQWAIPFARYLNRRSPFFNKLMSSRKNSSGRNSTVSDPLTLAPANPSTINKTQCYDPGDLKKRLHRSLQELASDYIDILLLHECQLANLNDEIVQCLQAFVDDGKILSYGLATGKSQSIAILDQYPELGKVVQVANTISDPDLSEIHNLCDGLCITHSAFALVSSTVNEYLTHNQTRKERWSNLLDYDLSTKNALPRLLLLNALIENQQGVVLFSSANKDNIIANTELINESSITKKQIEQLKWLIIDEVFQKHDH